MDCRALNETELFNYGILENVGEMTWFFNQLALEAVPNKIDELSVYTDIKHSRLKDCYVYILCMTKDGCTIGEYDYTEYEFFKSEEDFNMACDEYKGSAEKCHERYMEYMDNYHKKLLETI